MSRIKLLQNVVDDLKQLTDSLGALAGAMQENERSEPTVEKEQTVKESTIPIEEVRAVLAELSRNGKQPDVKALITEFGADKLTDIDPSNYSLLLKKAGEL